jgi:hypothetical protein
MKIDLKHIDIRHFVLTRRYFLVALASIAAGIGLMVFVVFLQVPKTVEAFNMLKQEKQKLTDLQKKTAALEGVSSLSEFTNRQKVDLALPSEKPLLPLLASTSLAAQKAQVSLDNIELTPGKLASGSTQVVGTAAPAAPAPTGISQKINGVDTLQIGMEAHGTLAQINAFVENIEHSTPFTDITQIKLAAVESNQAKDQFAAKLLMTTFYFTQPIQVGVDAPLPDIKGNEEKFLQNLNSFSFPDVSKQNVIQGGGLQDLFGVDAQGNVASSSGIGAQ